MKVQVLFAAIPCLLLAGCATQGGAAKAAKTPPPPKPVAASAPAPPPALSMPQTQVTLPPAQPLDPAALATVPPPVEAPPPAALPSRPRRSPPAAASTPAPPVVTPVPEQREAVQEIISPAESRRLQESAQTRRREVSRILDLVSRRQLNSAQRNMVATIRSFLSLSDEALRRNDPRQADSQAERAQILARELESGK
jgi:hypothetical protein